MHIAQYNADRYRTGEYAKQYPEQIHQYHPSVQKLKPSLIRHSRAIAVSTVSRMLISQFIV